MMNTAAAVTTYNPETINFYSDTLTAIRDNDGEIWAVMNEILRNIGFDETKVENQRKAWAKDVVIQRWSKKIPLLFNNANRDTNCINRKAIPLALAKISITPTMQKNQRELVDNLIRYQEECADVLYKHFYPTAVEVSSSTETSLTREEMAMYITVLQETNNEVKNSCLQTMSLISDVLRRQEEMFASQMSSLNKTANNFVINYGKNFDKLLSSIKPQRVENREESFLSEADKLAGIISSKFNMDQDTAYSLIYTKMIQKGINVYELKTSSSSSVIKAVAQDPELSATFEKCAKDLIGDYKKQSQKQNQERKVMNKSYEHLMTSRTHMMIPAEIKELVSKYQVKTNRKTFQYAMQTILKDLCKELGITHADLQKRAKAYARTIGHEKCSIGYLIAHDEELFTTLKKIAEG